jgi:hypothetical protein
MKLEKLKSKWTLFVGIALLTAGIVLRKMTGLAVEGLAVILLGVALKTLYIISKARSGEYVPGKELYFLFIGLSLFLGGLYLRAQSGASYSIAMIIAGISLKITFIILFIIKTRQTAKQ